MKMIVQFHDGQMIRQRVVYATSLGGLMRDYANCGIDMTTVIATNRHDADNLPVGYLHYEYPLIGDRVTGIWGA